MAEICPICCAQQRDETCGDCIHQVTARRYQRERHAFAAPSEGHFIVEINPDVVDAVNAAGELALQGKFSQARAAMEHLLRKHPQNHAVLFGMGVVHAAQGDHRKSIEWFDRATAVYPYFMEAHFNKAMACRKLLDVAGAIRASLKVVEVGDPKEREVGQAKAYLDDMAATIRKTEGVDLDTYLESMDTFNRAFALMEKGSWGEALAGFRTVAAKACRNAPTHGNMGICLAMLGRKTEALAALDRALEINPEYEPAMSNRLVVQGMQEGTPLSTAAFKSITFAMEQHAREQTGKSWVRRLFASEKRVKGWF
jgi:tetratricopeptide (TPR) repeat protein